VGLFRPYERSEATNQPGTPKPTPESEPVAKKKVPTPTRREAEAARRERLNPTLSPADQRKRDRTAKAKAREESWVKVDEQPGRILLRDFVDSRKGITQWWMPIIITSLAIALAVMYIYPEGAAIATALPYVAIFGLAIHITLLWRQFKPLHADRLPKEPLRGLLTYLINRMMNLRRFRNPLPRVNPGDEI
jgi:hypothetical protein